MTKHSAATVLNPKQHLQLWARKYFADKLRENGFVSYNGDDLNWYKVVNGELIQAVYLYSTFRSPPLFAHIAYGIYPPYVEAPLPNNVAGSQGSEGPAYTLLRDHLPRWSCDVDSFVLAPNTPLCGAELLDDVVFPIFSKVKSCYDAYLYAKEYYASICAAYPSKGFTPALELVDMALYYGDEELYPSCIKRMSMYADCVLHKDTRIAALQGDVNKRKEYLEFLEIRKEKFVKKLNKKCGIEVL